MEARWVRELPTLTAENGGRRFRDAGMVLNSQVQVFVKLKVLARSYRDGGEGERGGILSLSLRSCFNFQECH
jgi:hypothetical protein